MLSRLQSLRPTQSLLNPGPTWPRLNESISLACAAFFVVHDTCCPHNLCQRNTSKKARKNAGFEAIYRACLSDWHDKLSVRVKMTWACAVGLSWASQIIFPRRRPQLREYGNVASRARAGDLYCFMPLRKGDIFWLNRSGAQPTTGPEIVGVLTVQSSLLG